MTIPNASNTPTVWEDAALATQAQTALEDFVRRRLAEPDTRYASHLNARKLALKRLIRLLGPVNRDDPDIAVIRRILVDPELYGALRYIAGPPISADDLGVLVTRHTARINSKKIKTDPSLAKEILHLICRMADSERFPWLRQNRQPRPHELKQAIRATTAMHAAQTMQTERRGYGKEVEAMLCLRLEDIGFKRMSTPNKGKVLTPVHMPAAKTFYGECTIQGRRADLLIGLPDGRCVAVEAKDSSSVVNSVKRVLNDTAAKARHWQSRFGQIVVPVALLSGVFGLDNLRSAQSSGLFLVWSHELDSFAGWLAAQ